MLEYESLCITVRRKTVLTAFEKKVLRQILVLVGEENNRRREIIFIHSYIVHQISLRQRFPKCPARCE
jgi:hypothetical protein